MSTLRPPSTAVTLLPLPGGGWCMRGLPQQLPLNMMHAGELPSHSATPPPLCFVPCALKFKPLQPLQTKLSATQEWSAYEAQQCVTQLTQVARHRVELPQGAAQHAGRRLSQVLVAAIV